MDGEQRSDDDVTRNVRYNSSLIGLGRGSWHRPCQHGQREKQPKVEDRHHRSRSTVGLYSLYKYSYWTRIRSCVSLAYLINAKGDLKWIMQLYYNVGKSQKSKRNKLLSQEKMIEMLRFNEKR